MSKAGSRIGKFIVGKKLRFQYILFGAGWHREAGGRLITSETSYLIDL